MHCRIAVLLLALPLLTSCAAPRSAAKPFTLAPAPAGTLTVGLVVSSGTAGAQAQADALSAFVQKALNKPARAAVFPDYDSLASHFAEGKVDVGFLPPLAYVRATALGKVRPLAKVIRTGQPSNRSVLFAASGSALKSLDDVKKAQGLRAAWVDPSSATGYILAKAMLLEKGIDPAGVFVDQSFLGSHDAACLAVAQGKAQIGASYSIDPVAEPVKTITGCKNALDEGASALQIVAATDPIPNDVLAVRDGLPQAESAALLAAARALEASAEGKKTLETAFHAEGFTDAADADYAPVRSALMVFKQ